MSRSARSFIVRGSRTHAARFYGIATYDVEVAPGVGVEPTVGRLTAACVATSPPWNESAADLGDNSLIHRWLPGQDSNPHLLR